MKCMTKMCIIYHNKMWTILYSNLSSPFISSFKLNCDWITWIDHCMYPSLTELWKGPSWKDSGVHFLCNAPTDDVPFPKCPSRVQKWCLEFALGPGSNGDTLQQLVYFLCFVSFFFFYFKKGVGSHNNTHMFGLTGDYDFVLLLNTLLST